MTTRNELIDRAAAMFPFPLNLLALCHLAKLWGVPVTPGMDVTALAAALRKVAGEGAR